MGIVESQLYRKVMFILQYIILHTWVVLIVCIFKLENNNLPITACALNIQDLLFRGSNLSLIGCIYVANFRSDQNIVTKYQLNRSLPAKL